MECVGCSDGASPAGDGFSDRDNTGRETRTINDDAGRTAETIQNYAVDDSGQPLADLDTNLTSATTYHVTQQIVSTVTLSPNGTGETVPASGSLTPPAGRYRIGRSRAAGRRRVRHGPHGLGIAQRHHFGNGIK